MPTDLERKSIEVSVRMTFQENCTESVITMHGGSVKKRIASWKKKILNITLQEDGLCREEDGEAGNQRLKG